MAQEVRVRGIARVPFGAGSASTTTVSGSAVATLDLDNGQTRRTLQNERARFVVLPDLYPVMQVQGAVTSTSGTASGLVWRAPRAGKLTGVVAQVGTAPAGTALILDVKRVGAGSAPTAAGTSVFGTATGRRPSIGTGSYASTLNGTAGVPVNQDFAAGDYIRVEVAQAGTAGGNLTVQLFGYQEAIMATYVRLRGLSRRPFRVSNSSSSSDVKVKYDSIVTVDLDDQQTLRHLRNSGEGRYITASDNYFNLSVPGTVAVAGTASGLVIRAPRDLVVKSVDAMVGSNSGTVQFDVKRCATPNAAGTSIFGTVTASLPTIGTGSFADTSGSVVNSTWAKGEYLRIEVLAVDGATDASVVINADQI